MLTPELLDQLQTAEGERVLAAAAEALESDSDFLRAAQRVARRFPNPLARAAVEQTELRRRARAKFSAPEDLFFTREGLEQATSEAVARHRSERFRGCPTVIDLTCGIGADALCLGTVSSVIALDNVSLNLHVLRANARRRTLQDRIRVVEADARRRPVRPLVGAALFADPSRRRGGRRVRRLEETDPPLAAVVAWLPHVAGAAVKVSPAFDLGEVRELACEIEFVSERGDLKEATLWMGDLRRGSRRATVLPDGVSLAGEPSEGLPVGPLGAYLIEPDPAVLRAGLVQALGDSLGARLVSVGIGFLTSDRDLRTPFGRTYRILEAGRFRLKALRGLLAERRVGNLTVKRRGSPVEPEGILSKLRLRGDAEATLILTRVLGVSSMLLVERLDPSGGT